MAANPTEKKTRARRESEDNPSTLGSDNIVPTMTEQQLMSDAGRQLTLLIQELLLKTQELAFEYSTLDYDHLKECALADKCRELFKVMKRLNEFVRSFAQPQTPA